MISRFILTDSKDFYHSRFTGFLRDCETSLQRRRRDPIRDEDLEQEEADEEGGNIRQDGSGEKGRGQPFGQSLQGDRVVEEIGSPKRGEIGRGSRRPGRG